MIKSKPRRKVIRLPHYDYSSAGAYFVTLCIKDRVHSLGNVLNDSVRLSEAGSIVTET